MKKYDVLTKHEKNQLRAPRALEKTVSVRAHERRVFRKAGPQHIRNRLVKGFVEPFMRSIELSGGPTQRDVRHAQEVVQFFDDWGLLPDFEIRRRNKP